MPAHVFFSLLLGLLLGGCASQPDRPAPEDSSAQKSAQVAQQGVTASDVLRSWNDGEAKHAIADFVERVTREGGPTYLRGNGFKTYIVSGGGVEFMRPWAERVYGIPPEQVIGSSGKLKLEVRDGGPVLVKLAEIDLIDDKEGKPVGIHSRIGRRPIAAFGNSDGDLQMLQWATAGTGARFALFVHHDDAAREFAYDRDDKLQKFSIGWDQAIARKWTIVSMRDDWNAVFPSVGN